MKIFVLNLLLLFTIASCRQAERATYFLPKDFDGFFAVVYNQKSGKTEMINGKRQFVIPQSSILLTSLEFPENTNDDIFLVSTASGYDTLKYYLPIGAIKRQSFGVPDNKKYTMEENESAVNLRQMARSTFNEFDSSGNLVGHCSFEYEIIAIGRASKLNDSVGGKFLEKLDKYLKNEVCEFSDN